MHTHTHTSAHAHTHTYLYVCVCVERERCVGTWFGEPAQQAQVCIIGTEASAAKSMHSPPVQQKRRVGRRIQFRAEEGFRVNPG